MKPVSNNPSFPNIEKSILQYWEAKDIVARGLSRNQGKKEFVFYDGPPFATGLPHYGHLLAGTIKDVIPRYYAMKGYHVERRWGWDCHGLPVEYEMETELSLHGPHEIENYGVQRFNDACRNTVLKYAGEWEKIISRTGRWIDFDHGYKTMDVSFMESVWWAIQSLWEKKLIVEGYRVMPYSWRIGTPLSNFEASLNYKTVQDPSVTVSFESINGNGDKKKFYLAWTTTPWTLPSNLALAVHPKEKYIEIEERETKKRFVLAEERLPHLFKDPDFYTVISTLEGRELEGRAYKPLFPYFDSHENAFHIFCSNHVTTTDGTGIVHIAPYGEDDAALQF